MCYGETPKVPTISSKVKPCWKDFVEIMTRAHGVTLSKDEKSLVFNKQNVNVKNSYMNDNLSKILQNNSDIIIANLNGHSHRSRFNLYTNNNKFTIFGLINPSIYTDNNYPQFRLYSYENNILNYEFNIGILEGSRTIC